MNSTLVLRSTRIAWVMGKSSFLDMAALFPAGMMLLMQLLQTLARNVGLDLGGCDVTVPQQHLHYAQVGAVIEQVRRECMAKGMG